MINSDLFQNFPSDKKIDLIFFNPVYIHLYNLQPYVSTDEEELENAQLLKDISAAWAGGKNGSKVILRFIQELKVIV